MIRPMFRSKCDVLGRLDGKGVAVTRVLVKIDAARAKEADKKVWEDLDILHKAFEVRPEEVS